MARVVNQRRDVCPDCGATRIELVVAPGRFYCPGCQVAGVGPNDVVPDGAQMTLGGDEPSGAVDEASGTVYSDADPGL